MDAVISGFLGNCYSYNQMHLSSSRYMVCDTLVHALAQNSVTTKTGRSYRDWLVHTFKQWQISPWNMLEIWKSTLRTSITCKKKLANEDKLLEPLIQRETNTRSKGRSEDISSFGLPRMYTHLSRQIPLIPTDRRQLCSVTSYTTGVAWYISAAHLS